MNAHEFNLFAKSMKTFYPRDNVLPTEESMAMWGKMLQDLDYAAAISWLQKWVSTEKFPPTVAEIRRGCTELTSEPLPGWEAEWNAVCRAIQHYGWCDEKGAMRSLSPITTKVVRWLGWQNLCASENPVADRANFRDSYNRELQRQQTDALLSPALKDSIRALTAGAGVRQPEGLSKY